MTTTKKSLIAAFSLLVLAVAALCLWQAIVLRKAHSSFENYYAFRDCAQLLDRGPDYGTCRTADGQTIKIVLYQGRWFLAGDLPVVSWL